MPKTKKDESVKTTEKAASSANTTTKTRIRKSKKITTNKANSSKHTNPVDFKKEIQTKIDAFFEANKEFGIRKLVSPVKLIEAGASTGCYTKYWNPKMKPFIYSKRSGKSYTIDLLKCMVFMDRAYKFLNEIAKEGGWILFVGTRNDNIRRHIAEQAKRVKQFYVNQRWLGGTLTNFRTINRSIIKLNNLLMLQISDQIKKYTKKEQLQKIKETEKLGKFFGGIRTMKGLPQAVVVLDPIVEHNAVVEAHKLHIPVVALANTNADPTNIDFIVPCNTNSWRTTWLISTILADAVAEAIGSETLVVGKKDEEIVLPEIAKRIQDQPMITRTQFTKGAAKAEVISSVDTNVENKTK